MCLSGGISTVLQDSLAELFALALVFFRWLFKFDGRLHGIGRVPTRSNAAVVWFFGRLGHRGRDRLGSDLGQVRGLFIPAVIDLVLYRHLAALGHRLEQRVDLALGAVELVG